MEHWTPPTDLQLWTNDQTNTFKNDFTSDSYVECEDKYEQLSKLADGNHPPYLWAFLTGVALVVRLTKVFKVDILIIKV